jgi:hypothetical protein
MQQVVLQLQSLVDEYSEKFKHLSEEELVYKINAAKWSKKEIIGHLIDSAQNNIQRFVRAQYEIQPHILYNQDVWVISQNYQHYNTSQLIQLWRLLNLHICIILKAMPAGVYERVCNTGKDQEEWHTISFLAEDYVSHLIHHLKQIA